MLTWVDAVYVFDTGSVDDTWDIVQDVATRDERVVPLRKEPVYFSETRLRGWMFQQARQQMRDGDWFLRVDADEFHHMPPPEFVRTQLRKHETIAYHQYYNFCLLESEVRDWEKGRETLADRGRPIEANRGCAGTDGRCSGRQTCRFRITRGTWRGRGCRFGTTRIATRRSLRGGAGCGPR
jgi:glycosyltransferase involved in cell wall biosynthesis